MHDWDHIYGQKSLKYLLSGPLQKKFVNTDLDDSER